MARNQVAEEVEPGDMNRVWDYGEGETSMTEGRDGQLFSYLTFTRRNLRVLVLKLEFTEWSVCSPL